MRFVPRRRLMLGLCLAIAVCAPGRAEDGPRPAKVRDLGMRKRGGDWPCFLGPSQDSKSPETGILTTWPKTGPRLVWQAPVGLGYSMPTVSRGRLFLFDAVGNTARLRCLNSETGAGLWEFEYPFEYEDLYGYDNGPRAFPVVDEDRVYLYGVEGTLHCLAVEDGKKLWSVDTVKQFGVVQNFFGVGSTPIVAGELLIVQVGGSPPESQRVPPGQLDRVVANGTAIVAFDKRTGEVRYKSGDELASYSVPVSATIKGRQWGFLFARGGLLGFDPTSGAIEFHYPWRAKVLESVNASSPVVVDDYVFISETYGPGSSLLKAKPGGYDVVWSDADRRRDKSLQTHWNTPVHHEGFLYASSGRHTDEAELRCVELLTGKVRWSEPGLTRCSLLYVDGHFVCLAEYGKLYLLRATPEKFDLVASAVIQDPAENTSLFGPTNLVQYPAWAAPVLSHGLLYVRGKNRLLCLELIPE